MMATRKEKECEVTKDNSFADLGLEQPEELLIRSKLLTEVCKLIRASKRTQKEIATELGITQSKASLLVKGRLSAFSAETLQQFIIAPLPHLKKNIKKHKELDNETFAEMLKTLLVEKAEILKRLSK